MRAMHEPAVKTRFAPSPTGYLHLGNARTALFNALLAQRAGGVFLLRIEDTDAERSRPEYVRALMDDLRWLGLDWQEGPDADGANGPYRQSERAAVYRDLFAALERSGQAYPCFCSERELALARRTQRAAGLPPRYPGTCANLSPEDVQSRLAQGLRPTLRFRVPRGRTVRFDDLVRGGQSFATDDIGDFIIRRADGTPAFYFSNAVDDALMGVTHVLRGEDHLANTPRQLLLLEALGLPAPRYGHISLIVGADGSPLSKRRGSRSLRELREAGYIPGALTNYLARLGHHCESDAYMDLEGLAATFDLTRLGRAPARHGEMQLLHWQKEAVAHASDEDLWAWISGREYPERGRIEDFVPEGLEHAFVEAVRDNVVMPIDAFIWADNLFAERDACDEEAKAVIREAGAGFFRTALAHLGEEDEDFNTYVRALGQATGVEGKGLFMPLRAALTGELHGPELGRIWRLLGTARVRRRLAAAAALCES